MIFESWNVCTLMDNNFSTRPERRTALVPCKLQNFDIDVAVLSETRLANEIQPRKKLSGYTFFQKNLALHERRINGVGFAIKNSNLPKITKLSIGINESLMTLCLQFANEQYTTIATVYAPTMDADNFVKDTFYSQLEQILTSISKTDKIIFFRNFKARVGQGYKLWRGAIGKDEIGKCNSNETLLLTKYTKHNLAITNTVFQQKNQFKVF